MNYVATKNETAFLQAGLLCSPYRMRRRTSIFFAILFKACLCLLNAFRWPFSSCSLIYLGGLKSVVLLFCNIVCVVLISEDTPHLSHVCVSTINRQSPCNQSLQGLVSGTYFSRLVMSHEICPFIAGCLCLMFSWILSSFLSLEI